MQTMEHAISKSEGPRRFKYRADFLRLPLLQCCSVFSGIYAVIAFSVVLREQEMAVRMALGGQRSEVILLILSSGRQACGLLAVAWVCLGRLPHPVCCVPFCLK